MKTNKYVELMCQAFLLQQLLAGAPDGFPDLRELRIQNVKFRRMLDKQPFQPGVLLGSGSLKKWRKARGQYDAVCGQQAKHVKSMLRRSLQAWLRAEWEKDGKPYTKKAFREWKTRFDLEMSKAVAQMREYTGKARRFTLRVPPIR
jgi:hypothetical protein